MDVPSFSLSLPRFLLFCTALLPTDVLKKGSLGPREEGPGRVSRQPTHTAVRAHLRVTGRHVVGGQRGMACIGTKHTWTHMPIHMQIYLTRTKSTLTSASKGQREAERIMNWGWVRTPSENNPGRSFPGCPNRKAAPHSQTCSQHSASVFANCAEY